MAAGAVELPAGLLRALEGAAEVLILTGAGMSAESGVPTFRDAQTGLWRKYRPEDLATPEAFRQQPQRVWDWYAERRNRISAVRPHAGHAALVAMEARFGSLQLVTQNVDGLHQQAGSSRVIELHGNIMRSVCSITGRPIDEAWIRANPGRPPRSPHHPQGLARPAVVWFGEELPGDALRRAVDAATRCEVCFSIGTSSLVQPAASLPLVALEAGALFIEINPAPTPLTAKAHFGLQSTAAAALPAIASALGLDT